MTTRRSRRYRVTLSAPGVPDLRFDVDANTRAAAKRSAWQALALRVPEPHAPYIIASVQYLKHDKRESS